MLPTTCNGPHSRSLPPGSSCLNSSGALCFYCMSALDLSWVLLTCCSCIAALVPAQAEGDPQAPQQELYSSQHTSVPGMQRQPPYEHCLGFSNVAVRMMISQTIDRVLPEFCTVGQTCPVSRTWLQYQIQRRHDASAGSRHAD